MIRSFLMLTLFLCFVPALRAEEKLRNLVLIAGKPSHPPGMHEFNAGVQLLAKCLKDNPAVTVKVSLNGWPKDESILESADAIVFYMDGGGGHEVVQDGSKRLEKVDAWAKKGVGLGFMHFGVEIVPKQAGEQFHRWIGGYYEHMFSCNPMWEPKFEKFPDHPITRGVKPFQVKDEWYFSIRFVEGFSAEGAAAKEKTKFTPILVAAPSDQVRDGPYVYPRGPYKHIQDAKGKPEAMMWATEREDANGARGFGFTGGHFHDNWSNDDFRKTVLNALLWIAKVEVPKDGVQSKVTKEDLEANLDKKKK
jgi:type 1 glutamine amidotransferase